MKTVELGAYHMEERKTIENLSLKLRKICNDWGIDTHFVFWTCNK